MKSSRLSIILAAAIIILGYFIFTSIKEPLKFREEFQRRNAVVIARLIDIRTAEILFKQINKRYTGSFDTLAEFIKKGKIPVVKMVTNPKDTTFSRANFYCIRYIRISDSIFGKEKRYKPEDIAMVPFSGGAKFFLASDRIDKDSVSFTVFEASTPYTAYLKGLDKGLISNMVEELTAKNKFPGLKVGSLSEASTAGNWE